MDVLCAAMSDSAISHQLRRDDASGRIIQFETASMSEVRREGTQLRFLRNAAKTFATR
jgi:hypothetical protein